MKFWDKFFDTLKKKKIVSLMIMIFAMIVFFIGFYIIGPHTPIKGYLVVGGLILTVYGFINILT